MPKIDLCTLFERAKSDNEIQAVLDGLNEAISLLEGGENDGDS